MEIVVLWEALQRYVKRYKIGFQREPCWVKASVKKRRFIWIFCVMQKFNQTVIRQIGSKFKVWIPRREQLHNRSFRIDIEFLRFE
jgi:hypothetical protein